MPADFALNPALRGGAILVLLLLAIALLRNYRQSLAACLGAAFALGVASFAFTSAPGIAGYPVWWHTPFVVLASGNAIVLWLFTRALFDDDFVLHAWHAAVWLTLAIVGLIACFGVRTLHPWIFIPLAVSLTLSNFAFAVCALGECVKTWRTDLVEGRRKLRVVIVAAIGFYTIIMTTSALFAGREAETVFAGTLNAFGLTALSFAIALQLLKSHGDELFVPVSPGSKSVAPVTDDRLDPKLVDVLTHLIAVEHIYREHELTIGALAERMSITEHKLRRLINQGMGYRNFNAFLNFYRLEEIKTDLLDSGKAELPILTLALDAGFQSIGPFNRAFKAATGITPTEFRQNNGRTRS